MTGETSHSIPAVPFRERVQDVWKRMKASKNMRELWRLLVQIAVLAVAGWVLFGWVFLFAQANGNSMFPAVKDGDLLFGYRLQSSYVKNDVVLYQHEGTLCVGRVLGRAGDRIELSDTGSLLVNGSVQSGEILYPTYAKEGLEYPYIVPEGCVFILGDYRTQAKDSRDFGPVALTEVKAKVITLLRRRSL